MSDLWKLSATKIASHISAGQVSSREVIEAHLDRIARTNPALGAVTNVLADDALQAADVIDRDISNGKDPGPLAGVPMTVKEDVDVTGSATTHGLIPLRDAIAVKDSPHIAQLRAAGAIPIGRTNMPEFGMRWHTDNGLYGPTVNPWNADLTPGASSGGEAAAIAAGMSPLGMGSDGAGSLRWPAQCCGIAALKPSHGRMPMIMPGRPGQAMPFAFQLLAVNGPMARHIKDLRLAFGHMCGRSAGDPWHILAPMEGPSPATPMRVAVIPDPGGIEVHPDISASVRTASGALEDAGYFLEERQAPELCRANEIYWQIMNSFGRTTEEPPRAPVGVISADFDRVWASMHEALAEASGDMAFDPMMERSGIAHAWFELMQETPLIVAPIATQPAWKVGSDFDKAWNTRWIASLRMTVVVNLLGLPSVAVPTGIINGVPHAVQIIGPRFREDLCLNAAEAIENRIGPITPIDPRC